jgi:hypothetical protein
MEKAQHQFITNYNFTYKTQSINLFGAYGRYPLFGFYKIDEILNNFHLNLTYEQGKGFRNNEFVLESSLGLEGVGGTKENLFTINNQWKLTRGESDKAEDELRLGYNWFVYPAAGKTLPFKDFFIFFKPAASSPPASSSSANKHRLKKEDYFAHEAAVTLLFKHDSAATSYHPVNCLLSYKTSLQYPEHGFLAAEISVGWDKENIFFNQLYEEIYRFIIRLGIQGKLQF